MQKGISRLSREFRIGHRTLNTCPLTISVNFTSGNGSTANGSFAMEMNSRQCRVLIRKVATMLTIRDLWFRFLYAL
jgi:hypothetical protein